MGVRSDARLLDVPMEPVTCRRCRARVEVRKSSWDQTSVQWHEDAARSCAERRAGARGTGPNAAVFAGCSALRDSIRRAAVRGELPVGTERG
ncbi:ferredoxin [Saccharopolyspora sp. CA-218241]|uniref:ferredoxin n=1 Tax=Saccharopolyspora sp. CA-218241 TaxID=3240027 RepID=UPI003D96BA10